ncbi:Zn-dependent oxidoreductase [Escherichia coli]|uniref:Zn-dependent oxidoreductase n=7 Tax=Gammaproteobacteria TaxID=1236 RepID=UPI001950A278|nr:Zn-dependent oxidoreductase [Escherichia coli]
MKSILIEKPNQLAIVEREIPTPSAGEVRVKVKLAGICGSDSHIYRGHNPFAKYPRVIGHEFFGVIDAVGDGVESARVGERVAVDPVVSCGHCYPCSIGKPNVCTTLAVLGVHADGGFSEYAVVPAKNAWKIPEAVADQYAVMIEPFTIAANVTGHGQPTENDTVLVYGAGPIGLTIVQVLKGVYNVKNVIVADRIDERLEKAKESGADWAINNSQTPLGEIRTDIYHSLKFNDKNKLLQDSAIIISWNENNLNDMYYERIKKYKPNDLILDDEKDRSGKVFEVSFVRQGTPPFKYICRRSFFRPRDIIVYFNKIRACHKNNVSGLYTSNELYEADREASISVYNEVIDEWSNQFPEIENLLTVLQTIQVETFDFNDFSEKCRNEFAGISDGVIRQYINFLFDNSLIGQKKQGRWEYVSSLPNLKINLQNEFRTHHALKYRLHLIESRPSQNI